MKNTYLPIFTAPCVIGNRKTVFHKINEEVVVEAPGKLIRQLVAICDGTRPLAEIVQLIRGEWDEQSLRELMKALQRRGLITDSRHLSDAVWKTVENPPHFGPVVTDREVELLEERARARHRNISTDQVFPASSSSSLAKLLDLRRSIRSFSGQPIELQSIVDLLWSAYGEVRSPGGAAQAGSNRRTIPSAGALYPLMLHAALFKDSGGLRSGVYRILVGLPGAIGFIPASANTAEFVHTFAEPLMLDGAHGVIVISGSFRISGEKYGNRSMLYVPLEAGHAAQNVHLAAVEHNVATVEIGGFVDKLLAESLKLPRHYRPLTTIVFGREGEGVQANASTSKIEVQWAMPLAGRYRLPFTMAFARMSSWSKVSSRTGEDDWACGRALSPQLAHTKAVAEAQEWAACEHSPPGGALVGARFADLGTAIDPRRIIRFHPAQYRVKGFPLKPFSDVLKYEWAVGRDELRGSKAHVLAECVYLSYAPKTPRYARANSSGVAAHPDRQQAIRNGVLELVERDSFMIAYLAKMMFPSISESSLPGGIRQRFDRLRKSGFRVWIKDYSLDLAPVVFLFAQSEELAFTVCAGCAGFNKEEVLDHALMEIESAVLIRLANGPSRPVKPLRVRTPEDHGALYEQRRFFRKADFLVRGRDALAFRELGRRAAQSWQELVDRFVAKGWPLVTVPLSLGDGPDADGGLHVIRSIVPGVVPLSFGYRQEPCGMERILTVAKELGGFSVSYRDMPKFPHPYT